MARAGTMKVREGRADEGARLVRAFIAAGWDRETIAQKVHVSARTIYRWEKGERAPHPSFLEALRRLGGADGEENPQGAR